MEQKKYTLQSFALLFIIFLTSFGLGYYYSNTQHNKDNSENKNIVENFLTESLGKNDFNLDLFWTVFTHVKNNYYGGDDLKQKDLQYGLIQGYVNALGDKFSEFMVPEITKQFNEALAGDFEGIGAVIDKHDLGIIVDRVLKGSPALNNGVLKGDIIIQANDISLKGLTTQEAVGYIKGPAGTQVVLKIIRAGEQDIITKEITREKITIPSVDTKNINEKEIGYISLNMFGENTATEFLEILNQFNNSQTQGIIIDLRDNGGGYLQSAVEILSNFVEKGKLLVATKYKNSSLNNYYYSSNFGQIFDKKIVILINENSASASEITAGALRDYNKAILVGEKSYGKGSVQQPFDLPDGSMLKLTIAKWYTPKDYSIDNNGIEPDIKISFKKEDYTPELGKEKDFKPYDRQLEEAKKILKKFIKLDNISLVIDEYNKENPKSGSGELIGSGVINGTGSKIE